MPTGIHAFQIFYNAETRAALDPAFEPLDNVNGERPDWYEYWPIRGYFLRNSLDDGAYYGFLSPRFSRKTGLVGKQVIDFIAEVDDADVVTFSPWPHEASFFLNIFEQGDFKHPGLLDIASDFFRTIDRSVDLRKLVNHSRTMVFSNFFFAKPRFWRMWHDVFEPLFEIAEGPPSPLQERLNSGTEYSSTREEQPKMVHMKVFLAERIISFLLATISGLKTRNYAPFQMPMHPDVRPREVVALDALKIAYVETGDQHFISLFQIFRERLLKGHGFLDKAVAVRQ